MKLSCQIVQDLLPLYEDEVCSEDSREAVQAHLCECEACRSLCSQALPRMISEDRPQEEAAVKQGLSKIRRRWRLSVLAIVMIFPLVLIGLLAYHEYKKEGICFSNLNEIWSCSRFLDALEDGDAERAASYLDFSDLYWEYREAIEMTPEDFLPNYVEVKIGDETWMAYNWYAQEHLSGTDAADIWNALICGNQDRALIPLEVWNALMPREAQALQDEGYRLPNGTCYFPYETQWGTFMLIDRTWDALQSDTDLKLTDFVAMLPKEMYLALEPSMEAEAQATCDAIQERMKEYVNLSEDEFEVYMREKYAQKLKSSTFRLTNSQYYDVYGAEDTWDITFKAELEYEGTPLRVVFRFNVRDGGIVHLYAVGDAYTPEDTLDNDLHSVFSPRD